MRWFPNQARHWAEMLSTDMNLDPLMRGKDKNVRGFNFGIRQPANRLLARTKKKAVAERETEARSKRSGRGRGGSLESFGLTGNLFPPMMVFFSC